MTRTLDWAGNPLTETDAEDNTTTFAYDGQGRLLRKTDPEQGVTAFSYDLVGRKTGEVSPNHWLAGTPWNELNRKAYVYDLMGRVQQAQDVWFNPSDSQWETIVAAAFLYDANGNITKKLDALGLAAGTGLTYTQKASSGYGTEYTYNAANLCLTERDAVTRQRNLAFTRRYGYDAAGRKISEEDARGTVIRYTLNANGLLLEKTLQESGSQTVSTLEQNVWDLAGNRVSQTDANGNTTTWTYTAFNAVRSAQLPGDASIPSNLQSFQYTADLRLAWWQNTVGETTLTTYDVAGHVLTETSQNAFGGDSVTTVKAWDRNGNLRFSTDGNGHVTSYTYNGMNRMLQESLAVAVTTGSAI